MTLQTHSNPDGQQDRSKPRSTHSSPDFGRYVAYRRKTAAYVEWREKLSPTDRLPRGSFFRGKSASAER